MLSFYLSVLLFIVVIVVVVMVGIVLNAFLKVFLYLFCTITWVNVLILIVPYVYVMQYNESRSKQLNVTFFRSFFFNLKRTKRLSVERDVNFIFTIILCSTKNKILIWKLKKFVCYKLIKHYNFTEKCTFSDFIIQTYFQCY